MSGISDTLRSGRDTVFGFADDLSGALDFGSGAPAPEPIKTSNPEKDISEIDRSNPINHNGSIFGLPPTVVYIAGALIALVVVKKVL